MRGEVHCECFVISEMPMQNIEFAELHRLDESLDDVNAEEVTNRVNHDSPMLHQRRILHHSNLIAVLTADHLDESLQRVYET